MSSVPCSPYKPKDFYVATNATLKVHHKGLLRQIAALTVRVDRLENTLPLQLQLPLRPTPHQENYHTRSTATCAGSRGITGAEIVR